MLLLYIPKRRFGKCKFCIIQFVLNYRKIRQDFQWINFPERKEQFHGIFDMGMCPSYGVGKIPITNEKLQAKMKEKWNTEDLPLNVNDNMISLLENGMFKNLFIFGEDPLGCAIDKDKVKQWFSNADFILTQDYFMTETAKKAHLVLPASFPVETGGSFTKSQNVIQKFDCLMGSKIEKQTINNCLNYSVNLVRKTKMMMLLML